MNHLYISLLILWMILVGGYWFAYRKQVLKLPGKPEHNKIAQLC